MAQESVPAIPPLEERRRHISADGRHTAAEHFVPWRGGYLTANVITLPQEMLLYRVDNGRLIAEMQEYLQKQSLDWATWRERQEEHATQVKLHELLLEKARDAAGPIYQELRSEERRVGQECRCRWVPQDYSENKRSSVRERAGNWIHRE